MGFFNDGEQVRNTPTYIVTHLLVGHDICTSLECIKDLREIGFN